MEFTNEDLDISSLPKAEDSALTPIDRRYLKVMLLQRAIFFLFFIMAAIIAVAVFEKLQTTIWIVAIVGVVVLAVLGVLLVPGYAQGGPGRGVPSALAMEAWCDGQPIAAE